MSKINKEEAVSYLKQMMQIRQFEDKIMDLLGQGIAEGGSHLYAGEEAVAVGAMAAIRKEDYIVSTHRGHGHAIAKGGKLPELMAEILGKSTGCCRGKGGSLHLADLNTGNLGANGIVGGGFGIAVGAALSAKMKKEAKVVLSFFGDGASNTGMFHECMNMAGVWKLPVVFVCENNLYGMSVSVQRASAVTDIHKKAAAYGMPSESVDGQDVLAVKEVVGKWAEKAREGNGPALIEAKTYRYYGHSRSDPRNYRTKEEETYWKEQKDAIKNFGDKLVAGKIITQKDVDALWAEVVKELDEATQFAIDSPLPEEGELFRDLYA